MIHAVKVDRCDNCGAELIQRTLAQNDRYHAICTDIAQQVKWAGEFRSVETWKQLLSAAYERARGSYSEVLPAIDGHGVDVVYRSSARRGKKDMANLITYAEAWASDNRVVLHDPQGMAA